MYSFRFEERSLLKCHWIFIRERKKKIPLLLFLSPAPGPIIGTNKCMQKKLELPSQLIYKQVVALWWPTNLRSPISKSFENNIWKDLSSLTLKKKKSTGHWSPSQRGPLHLPTQCHKSIVFCWIAKPNCCLVISNVLYRSALSTHGMATEGPQCISLRPATAPSRVRIC